MSLFMEYHWYYLRGTRDSSSWMQATTSRDISELDSCSRWNIWDFNFNRGFDCRLGVLLGCTYLDFVIKLISLGGRV